VGGWLEAIAGQLRERLARLNPDGSLDLSFNAWANGNIHAVAIQRDGKILIGGEFTRVNGQASERLARLHADGSLDLSFQADVNGWVRTIVLQPDGRVLIGGSFSLVQNATRRGVARLNENGTVDGSFFVSEEWSVNTLFLQEDGKILLGGFVTIIPAIQYDNRITRLLTNGGTDPDFNSHTANDSVQTIHVQADGKVLVAGNFTTLSGHSRSRMARLHSSGNLDPGFQPDINGAIHTLALQANGKIWIGGDFTSVNGTAVSRSARLEPTGSLDSVFSPNYFHRIDALVLQPDGKLLVAQWSGAATFDRRFNDAPSSSLTVNGTHTLVWERGGGAPELNQVSFDYWDGSAWVPAGSAERIIGGWQAENLTLPEDSWVRARGVSVGGHFSGSSGQVEELVRYGSAPFPRLQLEKNGQVLNARNDRVDFGSVLWQESSDLFAFTLTNTGTATLSGISLALEGANIQDFMLQNPPPASLATGVSHTLFISFTPQGGGPRGARLNITAHDAENAPLHLELRGHGLQSAPEDVSFGGAVRAIAVQADEGYLLGGDFTLIGDQQNHRLARFLHDGGIDPHFFATVDGSVGAVSIQSDGKILLAGTFQSVQGVARNGLARLHPDGRLDDTFTTGTHNNPAHAILPQPDGRIWIGGSFHTVGGVSRSRIARLLPDGSVDPNFALSANGTVYSLAMEENGSLWVGGSFTSLGGVARSRIARILPDGSVDESFDTSFSGTVRALQIQSDGKVLVAGDFQNVSATVMLGNDPMLLEYPRSRMARLNSNGSVDTGFVPHADGQIQTIALQADGKIILGGNFTTIAGQLRRNVARLMPNGAVDASFDPGANHEIFAVGLLPNGEVLAGGSFLHAGGIHQERFARFANDSAVSELQQVSASRIDWMRGGSAPEVSGADFSLWNGSAWIPLPPPIRVAGGWRRTGLNLPANGWIRAQGQLQGGMHAGSSGLLEEIRPFGSGQLPQLSVSLESEPVVSGATLDFGAVKWQEQALPVLLTISNSGSAPLENISFSILGPDASSFAASLLSVHTLPPGESTSVTLNFAGTEPGSHQAKLLLNSSDGGQSPFVIMLNADRVQRDPDFSVSANATVNALLVMPNGQIWVGGQFSQIGSPFVNRLRLARLHPDGSLDQNFHADANNTVMAFLRQADGKILVAGSFTTLQGKPQARLARLFPDGNLDESFHPVITGGDVRALAEDADGNLFIGGSFTSVNGVSRLRLARLFADGGLDPDFDPAPNQVVNTLLLQRNGSLLVGGNFTSIAGQNRHRLVRFHPEGSLDASFQPDPSGAVQTLSQMPDGKLLVGGAFTQISGLSSQRFARLHANGSLDSAWQVPANGTVFAIALQTDGKIVLGGGFTEVNGLPRQRLARILPNGVVDPDFNPAASSTVNTIVLLEGGQLLAGGQFTQISGESVLRLARFYNDPATSELSVSGQTQINWDLTGSFPYLDQVSFEMWEGAHWAPLGEAVPLANGWQISGLALPLSGWVRALGTSRFGNHNGSASIIEEKIHYGGSPYPSLTVNVNEDTLTSGRSRLHFGSVGWRQRGQPIELTLFNNGSSPLETLSLQIHGKDALHFSHTPLPSQSLAPGQSASVWLYFTPLSTGLSTALLQIHSNDPLQQAFEVMLEGNGVHATASGLNFDGILASPHPRIIIPQADGKLLVAGEFSQVNGLPRQRLARLEADGALDTTFAVPVGSTINSLLLQSDGKILLGGAFTTIDQDMRLFLARLYPDGTLDDAFTQSANGTVHALALLADGQIWVGGQFTEVNGISRSRLARLSATGEVDVSFTTEANGTVSALFPLGDGRMLVGGSFTQIGGVNRNRLALLGADGTVDPDFDPNLNGTPMAFALQADGKILVGGSFTSLGGQPRLRAARIHPDGSLDESFNPGANQAVRAILVQADGKILFGGSFTTFADQVRERIARVHPDGTLDFSFNPGANGVVSSFTQDVNGDCWVVGQFTILGGLPTGPVAVLPLSGSSEAILAVQALNGELIPAASAPKISWGSDFGSTPAGTSKDSSFLIQNFGRAPLLLHSITLAGPHAQDFQVIHFDSEIAPESSGQLALRFSPTSDGLRQAVILLQSNDPARPLYALNVQGVDLGYPPTLVVLQGSQAVADGQSATFALELEGTPPFTVQWYAGISGDSSSPIPGATSPQWTTQFLSEGTHPFWARVHNAAGSADSPTLWATAYLPPIYEGDELFTATVMRKFEIELQFGGVTTSFSLADAPAWMDIDSETAELSGVPETTGLFAFTVIAANPGHPFVPFPLEIQVLPQAPVITSPATFSGQQNEPFSYQITATQSPETFAALDLPAGLTLHPATGLITGTPSENGAFAVELRATNAGGTGIRVLDLFVAPPVPPPVILAPAFTAAEALIPFSFTVQASGTPQSFDLMNAPNWVSISSGGLVQGTAPTPGTYALKLRASNQSGPGAWATISLQVEPHPQAPSLTGSSEIRGRASVAFTHTLSPSNPTTSFDLIAGTLPPGLNLNPSTGEISGTPSTPGTFQATLQATNAYGPGKAAVYRFVMGPAPQVPVITSPPAYSASLGVQFSITLEALYSPDSFTMQGLPAWLNQQGSTGQVSGTPTEPGSYTFSAYATNADGDGEMQQFVIDVEPSELAPVPYVPNEALIAYLGLPFRYELDFSSAADSITHTDLPPGLEFDEERFAFEGTPSEMGRWTVELQAANEHGLGPKMELYIEVLATPETPVIVGSLQEYLRGQTPFTFQMQANSEIPVLGFIAQGLPQGLTLNPSSGLISGAPLELGEFEVILSAWNQVGLGDEKKLLLTILPGESLPQITSSASLLASVGESITYTITATNGPITAFEAQDLPIGLSLNSLTGEVTGSIATPGVYEVLLRAANVNGIGALQTLKIVINPQLGAPILQMPREIFFYLSQPFSLQIQAQGMPVDQPWSKGTGIYAENLPNGMSINPSTGILSGIPISVEGWNDRQIRLYAVNDGVRGRHFTLRLRYFEAPGVRPIMIGPKQLSAVSGQDLAFSIRANQSSYAWEFRLYNGIHTFGDHRVQYNPNFVWAATRLPRPGLYSYSIGASSTNWNWGLLAGLPLRIAPAPGAPSISSPDILLGRVGEALELSLAASPNPNRYDADFTGSIWPSRVQFNPNTGTFTGSPTVPGSYSFLARARNANGWSLPRFTTLVILPAEAPQSAMAFSLDEDESGSFTAQASTGGDPATETQLFPFTVDGQVGVMLSQTPSYPEGTQFLIARDLPEGLVINQSTGTISGLPDRPGSFPAFVRPFGSFGIGEELELLFVIQPAPGTPVMPYDLIFSGTAGEEFSFQLSGTPAPSGYNIVQLPDFLIGDPFTGTYTAHPHTPGIFTFHVSAFNEHGEGNEVAVTLDISPAPGTPQLTAAAVPNLFVGVPFSLQLQASPTALFYDASGLPFGFQLNAETGELQGTPLLTGQETLEFWGVNEAGQGISLSLNFNILSEAIIMEAFQDAAAQAGLSGEDALPYATPFEDNIPNLVKYAFNLNLGAADSHRLNPVNGESGLPILHKSSAGGGMETLPEFIFLRRRNSMVYLVEYIEDLTEDIWQALDLPEIVEPINEEWERVRIPVQPPTENPLFIRCRLFIPVGQ